MTEQGERRKFKFDLYTLFVGAVIGIITGTISAFLSDHLTQNAWQTNALYRQNLAIHQKRIDLIEHTAQLIGKAPGIEDVWQSYRKQLHLSSDKQSVLLPDVTLSDKLGSTMANFELH